MKVPHTHTHTHTPLGGDGRRKVGVFAPCTYVRHLWTATHTHTHTHTGVVLIKTSKVYMQYHTPHTPPPYPADVLINCTFTHLKKKKQFTKGHPRPPTYCCVLKKTILGHSHQRTTEVQLEVIECWQLTHSPSLPPSLPLLPDARRDRDESGWLEQEGEG